ncbi:MAG: membrane protein insertase YidC [Ruminiclostridium sp.]|nr:membrane protein insertase YidC [Ruminiclostridium sp.]
MIGTPLGYIMWVCYALVQNVGWAIILFTFITRAAMFPINLKQQKNTAISQLYMPRVREIQTKYKNNQQKQQEELMKLQKEGYNPTGGCLPMLLTFLILFGVIDVVYKPMTHMEHFSGETINAIVASAREVDIAQTLLASPDDYSAVLDYIKDNNTITYTENEVTGDDGKKSKENNRIKVQEGFNLDNAKKDINVTQADLDKLSGLLKANNFNDMLNTLFSNNSRLSDPMRTALQQIYVNYGDNTLYRELRALNCYERDDANKQLIVSNSGIDSDISARLDKLSGNIYFCGINLGEQPRMEFNELIFIPIIAFVFSFAQMFIQQYLMEKQNPELAKQQGSMKLMLFMMPFVSLFIVFSVPAGAGFYWSISYLFGIIQSLIMFKFWPSDKIREEAKAKMEAQSAEREQRATVITVDAEGNEVEKTERISKLTQKEIKELNKKKLEAARRADAEKYGEEYVELPDDDDI